MVETTDLSTTGTQLDAIHCLTIPLDNETVILPNTAIAEVIGYTAPEAVSDAPDWFLGHINWRDKRVPLVSFESASGHDVAEPKKNSRIAILNTLNGNAQLPYVAIMSQGIPSLALVNQETINAKDSASTRQAISAFVEHDGQEVIIPNLDELEQRVLRLHLL